MDIKQFGKITCPHCRKKFRPISLFRKENIVEQVKQNIAKGASKRNAELVDRGEICAICAKPLELLWTIEHSRAVCTSCGAMYEGSPEGEVTCAIKENLRTGLRSIWKKYENDLATYSMSEPEHMSTETKSTINNYEVNIETDTPPEIPSELSPNDILKALNCFEKRDLSGVDEDIQILKDIGVLVSQRYNKPPSNDLKFYSFTQIKEKLNFLSYVIKKYN